MNTHLSKRIALYGNNRMAADLRVSPQAVSKWAKRGEVPPRRVLAVAGLLGLSPQDISPKVFGEASSDPAATMPTARPTPDSAPQPTHACRQPTSPHNIQDTVPDGAVVSTMPAKEST